MKGFDATIEAGFPIGVEVLWVELDLYNIPTRAILCCHC